MADDIDYTLPGDPVVDRMWIVRFAEWIAQRRFALGLTLLGILVLLAAAVPTIDSLTSKPQFSSTSKIEVMYSATGNSVSMMGSDFGLPSSPQKLSLMIIIGSSITALGALLAARRFSLRWLLIAVFITGILGAIPLQAPDRLGGTATISVLLPKPFRPEQMAELRKKLSPEYVLPTLPAKYREHLSPRTAAGVTRFNVSEWDGQTSMIVMPAPKGGITCTMNFHGDIDTSQRDTLIQFYDYYIRYLALQACEANGVAVNTKSNEVTAAAPFGQFQMEWLKSFEKLSKE